MPPRSRARLLLSSALLGTGLLAQAPGDAPPLAQLRTLVPTRERTQVLVLGTFHFRAIQRAFHPALVETLLARLERFRPDVIAVEHMPGDLIHALELRAGATEVHRQVLDTFAGRDLELGHAAQKALGIDALAARRSLAARKPPTTGPAALVEHTLRALAAYEGPSALLAWSRVPASAPERARVPAELAAKLDAELGAINETQVITLPLARRLGHAEVACVDTFEDLETIGPVQEALQTARRQTPEGKARKPAAIHLESERLKNEALQAGDLLPYFRFLNGSAYQLGDVDAQWGRTLRLPLSGGAGRARVALWEERNQKIAARIRALSARHPGKRVLVLYGAAHKPFLDAYLGGACDVTVLQPDAFLSPAP